MTPAAPSPPSAEPPGPVEHPRHCPMNRCSSSRPRRKRAGLPDRRPSRRASCIIDRPQESGAPESLVGKSHWRRRMERTPPANPEPERPHRAHVNAALLVSVQSTVWTVVASSAAIAARGAQSHRRSRGLRCNRSCRCDWVDRARVSLRPWSASRPIVCGPRETRSSHRPRRSAAGRLRGDHRRPRGSPPNRQAKLPMQVWPWRRPRSSH